MGMVTLAPGDLLVDWAYGVPDWDALFDPAGINAAGIIRYIDTIDPNNGKSVNAGDIAACERFGKVLILVHERASSDPLVLDGALVGTRSRAVAAQRVPGYPVAAPIIFAEDTDLTAQTLVLGVNYWALANSTGGPGGPYAEFDLIERVAAAGIPTAVNWQTQAWSGGRVSEHAHVLQLIIPDVDLSAAGITLDANRVLKPFSAWTPASKGDQTVGVTRVTYIAGRRATFFGEWQTAEAGNAIELCTRMEWIDGTNPQQLKRFTQVAPFMATRTVGPEALANIAVDRIPPPGSDGAHEWDQTGAEWGYVAALVLPKPGGISDADKAELQRQATAAGTAAGTSAGTAAARAEVAKLPPIPTGVTLTWPAPVRAAAVTLLDTDTDPGTLAPPTAALRPLAAAVHPSAGLPLPPAQPVTWQPGAVDPDERTPL